jgi:hypothetical protein
MYDLLKTVCGDECLSHTQIFKWFKRFKEGREEIGDDLRRRDWGGKHIESDSVSIV